MIPYRTHMRYLLMTTQGAKLAFGVRVFLCLALFQLSCVASTSNAADVRVRVRAPDGTPIPNTEISSLKIYELGKSPVLKTATLDQHGKRELVAPPSGDDGILHLSGVPNDGRFELRLFHPDWVTTSVKDLRLDTHEIQDIVMSPGVPIQLRFESGNGTDLLTSEFHFMALYRPRDSAVLYHPLTVRNQAARITVPKEPCLELRLTTRGAVITPYVGRDDRCAELAKNDAIDFYVHPTTTVTGRIRGDLDLVTNEARVIGWYPNRSNGISSLATARDAMRTGYPEFAPIHTDGTFSIDLPQGENILSFSIAGGYVDPELVEVVVKPQGVFEVGEIELKHLPPLRGKIVNEEGLPVPNAVVRLMTSDQSTDYQLTDSEGGYSLSSTELFDFVQSRVPGETAVIVAIDPNTARVGSLPIRNDWTPRTQSRFEAIPLRPVNREWVEKTIPKPRPPTITQIESEADRLLANATCPDFSEGLWLNSSAKSLADFRGKYVLIDFWFLGCGPCAREVPSLKLAHELFSRFGFSVIGVHVTTEPEDVMQSYIREKQIPYPVVLDRDGRIGKQCSEMGIRNFPTMIMIDPEGSIMGSPRLEFIRSLRIRKIEMIHETLLRAGRIPAGRE